MEESEQSCKSSNCEARELLNTKNEVTTTVSAILPDITTEPIGLMTMYACVVVEKKQLSSLVKCFSEYLPMLPYSYLKRVRKCLNGEMMILVSKELVTDERVQSVLQSASIPASSIGEVEKVLVPNRAPLTRSQFQSASLHWAMSFHEDKRLEQLLNQTFFTNEELTFIGHMMDRAVHVADSSRKSGSPNPSGAVIVDPSTKEVIAAGYDRRHDHSLQHAVMVAIDTVGRTQQGGAWTIPQFIDENSDSDNTTSFHLPNSNLSNLCTTSNNLTLDQHHINNVHKHNEQKADEFDSSAKFSSHAHSLQPKPNEEHCQLVKVEKKKKRGHPPSPSSADDQSYICTGYDAYVTREPCMMCAMALVHSRIRRVFVRDENRERGALISQYKLHCQRDLNHRYEVFQVHRRSTGGGGGGGGDGGDDVETM